MYDTEMRRGVRVVFMDGGISSELSEACAEIEGVTSVTQGDVDEIARLQSGDLILFDFEDLESVERINELRCQMRGLKVVVLTGAFEREKVFKALEFGIDGYLVMPLSQDQMVSAIGEAILGGAPMSTRVSSLVVRSFHKKETELAELGLTGREREVLAGLAEGFPYKQLASELQMGMGTVRTHIRHLYKKLGVHSRTEAVVRYLGCKRS